MATVSKHGKGWRAQIRRLGHPPLSKTFPLKGQAWEWTTRTERELLTGHFTPAKHTFGAALEKYGKEASPKKRGARWEVLRLAADPIRNAPISSRPIASLSSDDISRWRDRRLSDVSPSTVRREMNLLDSVLELARLEWKWIKVNPMRDVKKPTEPPSRKRRVPQGEIDALKASASGWTEREAIAGFLLGVETGMRAGEMWGLGPEQVELERGIAHLEKTKNGDDRDVPLSPAAVAIIRGLLADDRRRLFLTSNAARDVHFRAVREKAKIANLHFHDSRAEGIWRLSKVFDILELARVVGHRDVNSLLIYYQADAAELAKRLALPASKPKSPRQPSAGAKSGQARGRASGSRGR